MPSNFESQKITARNIVLSAAKQATYGTAIAQASMTRRQKFDGSAMGTLKQTRYSDKALAGKGTEFATQGLLTGWDSDFTMKADLDDWLAGWVLAFAMGKDLATGSGAPYSHAISFDETTTQAPAASIFIQDTNDVLWTLIDMGITDVTITIPSRGPISVDFSMIGTGHWSDGALTGGVPALTNYSYLLGSDCIFSIGAHGAPVSKVGRHMSSTIKISTGGNTDLLGSGYKPPIGIILNLFAEATDSGGDGGSLRALKNQLQGDVITLDSSVLYELAGDYEIMERYFNPIQQQELDYSDGNFVSPTTRTGQMTNTTDTNSGILQLVLRTFNPSSAIFTDISDTPSSSFATVPRNLPYAGPDAETVGWETSGSLTVSTPWSGDGDSGGDSTATWTAITLRLASGISVSYPGGSQTDLTNPPAGVWWIYINDPTLSGSEGCVILAPGYSAPTPGPGIYPLVRFTLPRPPLSGGSPPNVYRYTL